MHKTLGILLAGGAGERLFPLTRHRAKPAVPFGGCYRIVDVTLSNCINSGLRKVFILTQYKSLSLHRHIRNGWYNVVAKDLDEFIEVIPPQMRVGDNWYMGTADAVWQNLYSIKGVDQINFVMILSGDHIYKMNYYRMLKQHVDKQADVTIGAIQVPPEKAHLFGIMQVDESGRIRDFREKPCVMEQGSTVSGKIYASMGIYVFNKSLLAEILEEDAQNLDSTHDFGRDIIPGLIKRCSVYAHHFVDENKKEFQYWLDVGTLEAYYEANMDLIAVSPRFNLYDKEWPIRTYQPQYPPAKFVFAQKDQRMGVALDSIVSGGCIISGGRVVNSVLSPGVRINSYCEVDHSILFPHVEVGRHSRISKAIIDRGVRLPEKTIIGFDPEEDRRRFHVTESGIVVVALEDLRRGQSQEAGLASAASGSLLG
ncbi:MAG: glucose-1-phosphate adenylyltransferase [Acidobacteriia bacterium]|nr:glucose-1-phosphate adenylyltransferase [Terriglobia bacterium]